MLQQQHQQHQQQQQQQQQQIASGLISVRPDIDSQLHPPLHHPHPSSSSSGVSAAAASGGLHSMQGTPSLPDLLLGLCIIRMKADEQGRFGFNVKGGADQVWQRDG